MSETATDGSGVMSASEEEQRGRKHVFAVNGSSEFLGAIRVLFESESYNVTTTNFVGETFAQIAAAKPDVIVIDLAYRVQSGWDLMERLQGDAQTSGIPVVVVSTTKEYLEQAQARPSQYGGERFLPKPFDIDDMLNAIQELVGTA